MENSENNQPAAPSFVERNNTTIKALVIVFLLMVLLIPKEMVQGLVYEREYFRNDAKQEISGKWGYGQTLSGPILSVPYIEFYRADTSKTMQKIIKFAHFLPEELKIEAEMLPEKRYRSIYEVIVYNSKIHFEGYFNRCNVPSLGVPKENVLWNYASVAVGLNDLRGIEEQVTMDWNGQKVSFNPGMENNDVIYNGVSTKVPLKAYDDVTTNRYTFSIDLTLKGSEFLHFTPVGKETNVHLHSTWNAPSFDGAFLPDQREITADGFSANWKVLHLNRNYPQYWLGTQQLFGSEFGVNLLLKVDNYTQSQRAVKYAFLLIALTFALFFFVEMLNKRRIHPFHYVLVGLALCLFFTLLVSMSEHIKFWISYLVATIMTVGLVTWYALSILKDTRLAYFIGGTLAFLYGFIFIIVRLEDYSLLVGSFGLFVALAVIMHYARKIDWYEAVK
ncbi:MAG: hypothetical protein RLZZ292_2770 [Bacteroidota bacterium]|jgi:inner membrane protein